jgi:putative PIN family toxin of toxin-antitoxin system
LKAVLDTNVLVSGIFFGGKPHEVLEACTTRRFQLVVSPEILDEYRLVLDRFVCVAASPDAATVLAGLLRDAIVVDAPARAVPHCRDPEDQKFIDCALSASADAIISGDMDLLALAGRFSIAILTPAQFLSRL